MYLHILAFLDYNKFDVVGVKPLLFAKVCFHEALPEFAI